MMQPTFRSTTAAQAMTGERGFTLPEVLVALVLTLIMTSAALTTMLQTNRAALGATSLTDINQNLRVSMNIVIRDLLQAGGDMPLGGIGFPTGAGTQQVQRPGPIGSAFTWNADFVSIPSVAPGPNMGPIINGVPTDVVTVLRRDTSLNWNLQPRVTISGGGSTATFPATFPITNPVTGIKVGDLLMLERKTLVEVTSVNGQIVQFSSTATSKLNQHNAPQGSVNAFAWPPNGLRAERVLMITYYLTDVSGVQSLMRKVNYGQERKLAVGIENFQLTWDLVDGVTNPSNVDEPTAPNEPGQIRKANLHMAARGTTKTGSGAYMRSSLNTQVALRSMAFMERYQ